MATVRANMLIEMAANESSIAKFSIGEAEENSFASFLLVSVISIVVLLIGCFFQINGTWSVEDLWKTIAKYDRKFVTL